MNYIKLFNTYKEQLEYLATINETNYPLLILNKENQIINFSKDGTYNRIYQYQCNTEDKYLNIEKNYINPNFFIYPKDVQNINVYDENQELIRVEKLNQLIYSKNNQLPIYKVGLMSDIHYNDYDYSDDNPDTYTPNDSEYSEDLQNVLKYFYDNDIEFITCSGDITTDSVEHMRNYHRCVNKYGYNLPIYTCAGNHDTFPKYTSKDEWKLIDHLNSKFNIIRFADEEFIYNNETITDDEGTSFYFEKEFNNQKDIYIFLNVEYGWGDSEYYDTHHCRYLTQEELLVHQEVQNNDFHLYNTNTLKCFSCLLEKYKNNRCFIFTHLMFENYAGSYHGGENYYRYYYTHQDVLCGDQGEFLDNLVQKYDNNYWFSGHSHYKWNWEKDDHTINITKVNNSYTIHLPSLSCPFPLKVNYYTTDLPASEAGIMEVYQDYVIINGLILKDRNFNTEDNQNFPNSKLEYVKANMFTVPEGNESYVEQLDDNYILMHIKYINSEDHDINNIYLNPGNINSSNFNNLIPILRFEDIIGTNNLIIEDNSLTDEEKDMLVNEFTKAIITNHKIGFRDNTTDPEIFDYYFESNHVYSMYQNGIIFKISHESPFVDYEYIDIKLKMKIGFIHEKYPNQILPIAIFKLQSNKKEED